MSLVPVTAPVTKPKPAEDAFSVLCPFGTEQCEPVNKNKRYAAFQCWDLMSLMDCCETAPGVLGAEEREVLFLNYINMCVLPSKQPLDGTFLKVGKPCEGSVCHLSILLGNCFGGRTSLAAQRRISVLVAQGPLAAQRVRWIC